MSLPADHPRLKKRAPSRNEIVADGIVHGVAILFGIIAFPVLFTHVTQRGGVVDSLSLGVYALTFFLMFGFSCAYNMTPPSPLKWLLRRFDHASIYLMIAGTYTALLARLDDRAWAWGLIALVWLGALGGGAIKLFFPGRWDKLSIALYMLLGAAALVAIGPIVASLPRPTLVLIGVGGALYCVGVLFYIWHSLKFQSAIWHGFVAAAASCQWAGIAYMMGTTP